MKKHIHIFGASGSGTTTIARLVSDKLGYKHFDSDDYFWVKTKEPFTVQRDREECFDLLEADLSSCDEWVLSGSVVGWGDDLHSKFDLIVFVYVPGDIRLERLEKREYERYGDEILAGGSKYESSQAFLNWAATYDGNPEYGRSLQMHENWIQELEQPVFRIENINLGKSVDLVLNEIRQTGGISCILTL